MPSALDRLDALLDRQLIRLWRLVMDQQKIKRPSVFSSSGLGKDRIHYICYGICKKLHDAERNTILVTTKHELMDSPEDEILELIRKSRANSDTPSGPGRLRGQDAPVKNEAARLLQLDYAEQKEFHDRCTGFNGRYLIFRFVKANQRLLVSFMRISRPDKQKLVATYTTIRPATVASDERTVQGIIYCTGSGMGARIFSIGKLVNSSQVRMASLIMHPRRSKDKIGNRIDLIGVRLGLGAIDQQPRAYRIWCYQLRRTRDQDFLKKSLGDFSVNDKTAMRHLAAEISNFKHILQYLKSGHDASVGD